MTWTTLMDNHSLSLHEEDVIKLILEYLSARQYHVTMRTLEKESGVTNCDYSDEVIFLRDLVLDGEFDEVIQFGNSFTATTSFNQKRFNFIVLKQKYIELIYTKSHIVGKQTFNIIEDVMKTLAELKSYCSSKEEYGDYCYLLTVPNLNSVDQFQNWSLDVSRLRCFEELLDCLTFFMPLVKKKVNTKRVSSNDRLLHLVVKGLFYESCIDYCQSVGSGTNDVNNEFLKKDLLKSNFDDYSSNLLSWVLSLPYEAFVTPFQQIEVDVRFNRLTKHAFMAEAFYVPNILKGNQSGHSTLNITDPAEKMKISESLSQKFGIIQKTNMAYSTPVGSAKYVEGEMKRPMVMSASSTSAKNDNEEQKYPQPAVPSPIYASNRDKLKSDASTKLDTVETQTKVSKPVKAPVVVKSTKSDISPLTKPDSQDKHLNTPHTSTLLRSPGTIRKKTYESTYSSEVKKNQTELKRPATTKDTKISTTTNIKDSKKYDRTTPKMNQTGN